MIFELTTELLQKYFNYHCFGINVVDFIGKTYDSPEIYINTSICHINVVGWETCDDCEHFSVDGPGIYNPITENIETMNVYYCDDKRINRWDVEYCTKYEQKEAI